MRTTTLPPAGHYDSSPDHTRSNKMAGAPRSSVPTSKQLEDNSEENALTPLERIFNRIWEKLYTTTTTTYP
ncbi:Hypothetical predicted protein [Pelobates cultripes]|uniref:Uncharacterized protein n=1 Tax=Pelobates cultripes TaxID=61616 RepID=A0AAD1W9S7_PELCU|nr:Hypothetical predicted protein [Pelobates cultripes]